MEQLKAQQAGAALRHLGDAKELLVVAQAASKAYDRADPVTSAVEHEYADLDLKDAIEKPYARVIMCLFPHHNPAFIVQCCSLVLCRSIPSQKVIGHMW